MQTLISLAIIGRNPTLMGEHQSDFGFPLWVGGHQSVLLSVVGVRGACSVEADAGFDIGGGKGGAINSEFEVEIAFGFDK